MRAIQQLKDHYFYYFTWHCNSRSFSVPRVLRAAPITYETRMLRENAGRLQVNAPSVLSGSLASYVYQLSPITLFRIQIDGLSLPVARARFISNHCKDTSGGYDC